MMCARRESSGLKLTTPAGLEIRPSFAFKPQRGGYS